MDAATFERRYAERSGVTVEQLRAWGRVVASCDCGEPGCEGFQSINAELLDSYRSIGRSWIQLLPAISSGQVADPAGVSAPPVPFSGAEMREHPVREHPVSGAASARADTRPE